MKFSRSTESFSIQLALPPRDTKVGRWVLGPVNVEKSVTGKRVTLPSESTHM